MFHVERRMKCPAETGFDSLHRMRIVPHETSCMQMYTLLNFRHSENLGAIWQELSRSQIKKEAWERPQLQLILLPASRPPISAHYSLIVTLRPMPPQQSASRKIRPAELSITH